MQSCMHQRHASKTWYAFCLIQVQVITLSLFSVPRDNNRKPAPRYNLQKQRYISGWTKLPVAGNTFIKCCSCEIWCIYVLFYSYTLSSIYLFIWHITPLKFCLFVWNLPTLPLSVKLIKQLFLSLDMHIFWKIDWLCYKNK